MAIKLRQLDSRGFWFMTTLAILSVRSIHLFQFPTLWAEELVVLIGPNIQSNLNHISSGFLHVYAGQFWALQELLISVLGNSHLLTVTQTPRIIIFISIATAAWFLTEWVGSGDYLLPRKFRILILVVLTMGSYGWEVVGSLANLHAFMQLGLIALAFKSPIHIKAFGKARELILVVVASLTGITSLILLVVTFVRFLYFKSRYLLVNFCVVALLMSAQLPLWYSSRVESSLNSVSAPMHASDLTNFIIKKVFTSYFLDQIDLIKLESQSNYVQPNNLIYVVGAFTVISLIVGIIAVTRLKNEMSEYSWIVLSPIVVLTAYWGSAILSFRQSGLQSVSGAAVIGRYIYISNSLISIFLICALWISFCQKKQLHAREARARRYATVRSCFVACAIASHVIFGVSDFIIAAKGDRYSQADWVRFVGCIKVEKKCPIAVAPGRGWTFTVHQATE